MNLHHWDRETGEYTGKTKAELDPEATKRAGSNVYSKPAWSTPEKPPLAIANTVAVRVGGVAGSWVVKEDHRGKTVYKQADKSTLEIEDIGPLPAGYTEAVPGEFDSWVGSGWVTGAAAELVDYQVKRMAYVDQAVEQEILTGFNSSALGTVHFYPSGRDSQTNLVGAVAKAGIVKFICRNAAGDWLRRPHTAVQIKQVLDDGAARMEALLDKLDEIRAAISAAADKAAVDAVVIDFSSV